MKRDGLTVAVLMGGATGEREVSLRSGAAVARALRGLGARVLEFDLKAPDVGPVAASEADVAFVAIHGGFGEDGRLQKALEAAGMPYTGSGPYASALAMDKLQSKVTFAACDVPTPAYRTIRSDAPAGVVLSLADALGYPVVIKPRAEGSSLGVSFHKTPNRLMEGAAAALQFGRVALMERAILGRELTVGILGGMPLPVVEIRTRRGLFDFDAKYADSGTQYLPNPDLPKGAAERVQETALKAHRALEAGYLSRVDLLLDAHGVPYVLEANTVPGMTERSLLPMAAAAAGIEFPELCRFIVDAALARANLVSMRRRRAAS
jgi:D-alanine-D-alanine ligase